VTKSQKEDELIFAELYPRLRAFASVVGPRSLDPDDLVQEALVRTLAKHRLAELDHPLAYLRRVVHNLSTDQMRAEGRRHLRVPPDGDQDVAPHYPSDLADLEHVSATDRALVYMIHVESATYSEAAGVFGGSEASLRKRSQRALAQLRAVLVAGEEEAGKV